ncbi:class I SAM-dependent methyltransferase [Streptomyces sp. DSM 41524]|uniref:Class I SAM-dependent methyltransferase n=2 Tax=Streptomyces asiaticus TaxID=114695 RepID=A0ABU7Q414_9ACTN|nr:class I SAM-dependent methyltransferase [Streptomyces sp. DSM 41524]
MYAVLSDRWTPAQCAAVDRGQKKTLVEALPRLRGKTVLDVGCGIGRLSHWLAAEAEFVTGVDSSLRMVTRARGASSAANTAFVCGRAEALPFRSAAFDLALTTAVLQHVVSEDAYERACAEAVRVLRPGGALVCFEGAASDTAPAVRTTATTTVHRPLAAYVRALGPAVQLDQVRSVNCLGDEYTVMRWTRVGKAVA